MDFEWSLNWLLYILFVWVAIGFVMWPMPGWLTASILVKSASYPSFSFGSYFHTNSCITEMSLHIIRSINSASRWADRDESVVALLVARSGFNPTQYMALPKNYHILLEKRIRVN